MMPVSDFAQPVASHKATLVYISAYAVDMTLTRILPQHIIVAVVQHRLVRRILGYHKLVAVHNARHILIVEVGTCIDKRFLMICFLHHCQKCHQRIAESIVRQSLLCLYINHRYQVLLRGAALSLKVLKLQLKGLKVIGEDGRIHTRFNQTEARTGRLSSDNPNLQNIPIRTEMGSKLRAYFVAKPGCVLVDADYSQIELRILAHVTGDAHMQEAFLSGADIHRSTAAKIYNIRPEDVTPRLRSSAKAINFGIMYGKGAYSLSKDIGVSVKEAEAFLQTYLATFPNIDGYMEKTIADARQCGYVSTLFGRRRALPELNSNNHNIRASGERMARNTPIQGTAADVIKLAMVRVWRRLRDEKMESRLILTVHDELIVEAPEAEAAKAAAILQEEMEGCVNYAVPLSTEVHQGKNWLEAH